MKLRAPLTFAAALALSGSGVAVVATPSAQAAEGTEVASAFDEGDAWDAHFSILYSLSSKSSAIKREFSGLPGTDADDPVPLVRDLVYSQKRHVLTPRAAFGVFRDLELSVALPIVLSDSRTWDYDRRDEPCLFPGGASAATCINAENSSTIRDGLLPGPGSPGGMGFDANDPNSNFADDSAMLFRGIGRAGLDQIHLGATYAILSQARDPVLPTWVIGIETRISIGKIMRFDRTRPFEEDGVSSGLHELKLSTGFSRHFSWAEPFVHFYWQSPFGQRGDEPDGDGTLYWDAGFGQDANRGQQKAGTVFGFEALPWQKPEAGQRIGIELRGRVDATFDGRGYSEMWEPFAYAGDATSNSAGPLVLDRDPTSATDSPLSHPGVTSIENYLTLAGSLAVRGHLGPHARFGAGVELAHDQSHRISFTDAGNDGSDADTVVTPGTAEVNPLHVRSIDLPGRRYVVDDSTTFSFFVSGALLF